MRDIPGVHFYPEVLARAQAAGYQTLREMIVTEWGKGTPGPEIALALQVTSTTVYNWAYRRCHLQSRGRGGNHHPPKVRTYDGKPCRRRPEHGGTRYIANDKCVGCVREWAR